MYWCLINIFEKGILDNLLLKKAINTKINLFGNNLDFDRYSEYFRKLQASERKEVLLRIH